MSLPLSTLTQETRIFIDQDVKLHTSAHEALERDSLKNFIINEYPKLYQLTSTNMILVTINVGAENIFSERWDAIQKQRTDLHSNISKLKGVFYTVSTIEHHHTDPMDKIEKAVEKAIEKADKLEKSRKAGDKVILKPKPDLNIRIYKSTTLENFLTYFNILRLDSFPVPDVSEIQKRYILYNFFHYLKFNARINKVQPCLMEFIDDNIKTFSVISTVNPLKPHEIMLVYLHKKYAYTTLGFPHLHLAIGFDPSENIDTSINMIRDIIKESNISPDYLVEPTKTPEAKLNGIGIQYVLKNASNEFCYNMLNNNKQTGPIVLADIYSSRFTTQWTDFFYSIGSKNLFINGHNCGPKKYYRPIPITVTVRKPNTTIISNPVTPGKVSHISYDQININASLDLYHQIVHAINVHMRDNKLVMCESTVYQKLAGTRMTYQPYCKPGDLYDSITSTDPFATQGSKYKKQTVDLMIQMCKPSLIEKKIGGKYIEFPVITIDYRMLEYKDFFLSTLTRKIYLNQTSYYCFFYSPTTLKDLFEETEYFLANSVWIAILRNSNLFTPEVLLGFYTTLIPPIPKCPVPILYGESDSGKSTLFKVFQLLFPNHLIGRIGSKLTEYHVADQLPRNMLFIMEECNDLVRSLESSTLLKFLENDYITANKKHGEITSIRRIGSLIGSMNPKSEDYEFSVNDAVMNRLYPIGPFKKLGNGLVIKDVEKRIEVEAGPVVFFIIRNYETCMGIENKGLVVIPDITPDDIKEIENIKKVYIHEKSDVHLKYSMYSPEWEEYIEDKERSVLETIKKFSMISTNNFRNVVSEVRKTALSSMQSILLTRSV